MDNGNRVFTWRPRDAEYDIPAIVFTQQSEAERFMSAVTKVLKLRKEDERIIHSIPNALQHWMPRNSGGILRHTMLPPPVFPTLRLLCPIIFMLVGSTTLLAVRMYTIFKQPVAVIASVPVAQATVKSLGDHIRIWG